MEWLTLPRLLIVFGVLYAVGLYFVIVAALS